MNNVIFNTTKEIPLDELQNDITITDNNILFIIHNFIINNIVKHVKLLSTDNNETAILFYSLTLENNTFDFIAPDNKLSKRLFDVDKLEYIILRITNQLTNTFVTTWISDTVFDKFYSDGKININKIPFDELKIIYPIKPFSNLYEFNHYVSPEVTKHTKIHLNKKFLVNEDNLYYVDSRINKYGIVDIYESAKALRCRCNSCVFDHECELCLRSNRLYLNTIYGDLTAHIFFILTDSFKKKYLNPSNITIADFKTNKDYRPHIKFKINIPNCVLKILNKLNIEIQY